MVHRHSRRRNLRRVSASGVVGILRGVTPADIDGLVLWLKSDTLNLADGATVGTWPDESGQGNDLTQTTEAKKPLYKTSIINGKPVVRFDGTDDVLVNTSFPDLPDAGTILCVATIATGDDSQALIELSAGAVKNTGMIIFHSTVFNARVFDGALRTDSFAGDQRGAFHVFGGRYDGTEVEAIVDNAISGTPTTAGALTNTVDRVTLGVLADETPSWAFDGDIAEVLVYDRDLSATERNSVVADYLIPKFNLT